MKERNEWLDPSQYLSKRDLISHPKDKNIKRNTNSNNNKKPATRSRSLSPAKTVRKQQSKKISFQELYMKENNTNNVEVAANDSDSKCIKPKPKPKKVEDINVTKNINMNIFRAASFRSSEITAIKGYKPKQLDRFNGGKTYF